MAVNSYQLGNTSVTLQEIEEKVSELFKREGRIFGFDIEIAKDLTYTTQILEIKPIDGKDILWIAEQDHDLKIIRLSCNIKKRIEGQTTTLKWKGSGIPITVFYHPDMEDIVHYTDPRLANTILKPATSVDFIYYPVDGELKDGVLSDLVLNIDEKD